jgi:tryptophanyl-tRNA synthetase
VADHARARLVAGRSRERAGGHGPRPLTRVLTGIKPTGSPHLGNLAGAIRPGLRLADEGLEALYFIADYHALTTIQDRQTLARLTREVAATWLAMGLDPDRVLFYRQSDIPEIFELAWALACFTPKGWMNKAHAYKAAVAANVAAKLAGGQSEAEHGHGESDSGVDAGINMGLYGYPVLMAADILAFDADLVPVGRDQAQHVEIARDIAQRVNHAAGAELLRPPRAKIDEATAIVPGLDGRKMSKSYDNTIPLFAPAGDLKKAVARIVTDSAPPDAPKDPAASTIFQIHRAFATPEEAAALADRYRAGIGWGEAKRLLLARLEQELSGPRKRYQALMAEPAGVDALLAAGAARARPTARKVLDRVRRGLGIDR